MTDISVPVIVCLSSIIAVLEPAAFQACFQSWIASLMSEDEDLRPTMAIDGKTLRRSDDQSDGLGPLHLVSVRASEHRLALRQVATEEKSNEITAISQLIDRIDLKSAIVAVDATSCQKEIARKIVNDKGDYVLAVKDNQPELHGTIKNLFSDECPDILTWLASFLTPFEAGFDVEPETEVGFWEDHVQGVDLLAQ